MKEKVNFEKIRAKAAIQAMSALLVSAGKNLGRYSADDVARDSVMYAEALVERLKFGNEK